MFIIIIIVQKWWDRPVWWLQREHAHITRLRRRYHYTWQPAYEWESITKHYSTVHPLNLPADIHRIVLSSANLNSWKEIRTSSV